MCGFAGFVDPRGRIPYEQRDAVIKAMIMTLGHRGPDDNGVWRDDASGMSLGHRRLSILDLSPLGHQPMASACGRFIVAFNGEIYNFRELRAQLAARGYPFRGGSDTEVLLGAVSTWGVPAALQRFVGMFAFALWDCADRVLYLARDRIGEKPLYYGWSGGVFLFGSELKALRAHPCWVSEYDRDALHLFLQRCYVPAPLSIYRGMWKLLPGTFLRISDWVEGRLLNPVPYWSAQQAVDAGMSEPFSGTPEEAVEHLDALLRDAVGQQMVADVPLGAFLSGGVDSSTIVALMQAQSGRPVKTFSIGFFEERYNEAHHARAVASHLGTDHSELYVTAAEAMAVIPRLPHLYDEPFADSSQIPTFLVSQLAKASVTVSLSGDGGDELFAGYVRYFLGPRIWDRIRRLPLPVRRIAARTLIALRPATWDRLMERIGPGLPQTLRQQRAGEKIQKLASILAAEDPDMIYRTLVSSWDPQHTAVIGGSSPADLLVRPQQWPRADGFASHMMYLDLMTYLPDDILVKVDRAAMGVSLESRVPFLDHRVVEFAWRLPLAYKIRNGVGKWPLRQVLYRYVPRDLIERPKAGFAVPVGEWIRGPLREWCEELLDERRLADSGLFDPVPIRKYWEEHRSGTADRSAQLWCVLMFQAWEEVSHPVALDALSAV
jgi:asparagine synthase (glutamine-hydrolysing)